MFMLFHLQFFPDLLFYLVIIFQTIHQFVVTASFGYWIRCSLTHLRNIGRVLFRGQRSGIEQAVVKTIQQFRQLQPVSLRHLIFPQRFGSALEFTGIEDLRLDLQFLQGPFKKVISTANPFHSTPPLGLQ